VNPHRGIHSIEVGGTWLQALADAGRRDAAARARTSQGLTSINMRTAFPV
jgi:hypothetical protein